MLSDRFVLSVNSFPGTFSSSFLLAKTINRSCINSPCCYFINSHINVNWCFYLSLIAYTRYFVNLGWCKKGNITTKKACRRLNLKDMFHILYLKICKNCKL